MLFVITRYEGREEKSVRAIVLVQVITVPKELWLLGLRQTEVESSCSSVLLLYSVYGDRAGQ